MLSRLGEVKLDKHTVALKDEGDWYGYDINGEIVSVLCIRKYHNGNWYISENFTKQEHRGKGYFTKLLDIVLTLYRAPYEAHCLLSSASIYHKLGFRIARIREYKNGTQYIMIKEGQHNA